jgi:hypothetical protein
MKASWTLLPSEFPPGCGIRGQSSISLPDGIYLIGGLTKEGSVSSSMYKFDPSVKTIEFISSMNCERSHFQVIVSPTCDFIYILGGLTTSSTSNQTCSLIDSTKDLRPTNHVEKYDV